MSKFQAGKFSLALLSMAAIGAGTPALAEVQTANSTAPKNSLTVSAAADQPTTQSDEVLPTDRNVQILKSINSKYQCGVSNLDRTLSRSDFAGSIVTCLEALETKIAQNSGAISASDLSQLKELTNSFMSEVSSLNNRVEIAEKKVAALQTGSTFSTTTKLVGEVVIGVSGFSGQTGNPPADTNGGNIVATNRVRLNFDTSFTGKDRLRTRLESRNNTPFNGAAAINGGTGTNTTRLGWDGDEGNSTNLSLLQYSLPVFNGSKLILDATGSEFNENMYTFNPLLAPAAVGSFTRFGRFNPVYRQSGLGTAATLDYKFSKEFSTAISYAVPGAGTAAIANNPGSNAGIFGGNYSGIVQIRYTPSPSLDLGLSYARTYHSTGTAVLGGTGSGFANSPFGGIPTSANHYSLSATSKVSPGFVLSGWVGLTNANRETGTGNADIFNAAVTAAFPDLGSKGNTLGFVVGIPPKVTSSSIAGRVNPDTALHLETFYKVKINNNIYITPGVLLITNPESSSAPGATTRGSEFVGTVRTTFFF